MQTLTHGIEPQICNKFVTQIAGHDSQMAFTGQSNASAQREANMARRVDSRKPKHRLACPCLRRAVPCYSSDPWLLRLVGGYGALDGMEDGFWPSESLVVEDFGPSQVDVRAR